MRSLKAGALECLYDRGALRHVRVGGIEVLRMIYPAVRDRDWGTVRGEISGERIEAGAESFRIAWHSRYQAGEIDYRADFELIGKDDSSLVFRMEGKALSSFLKNRMGLNILHPIRKCAGKPCRVGTPEGESYEAEFPRLISPHQPMKNIRSLVWEPAAGIRAMVELSGETFEMEDQRNWTDASYKTYCTPLELPFPARVESGETHLQEVSLKLEISETAATDASPDEEDLHQAWLEKDEPARDMPKVGVCRSSDVDALLPDDRRRIRDLQMHHYRVDLHLYRDGWEEVLERGVEEARDMGLHLELALFFGEEHEAQLRSFLSAQRLIAVPVDRILVFTSDHLNDPQLTETVIPELKKALPEAAAGTGTNANFAELNRNRPGMDRPEKDRPDFLSWSINPQVHAFDDLSLVENIEAQGDTVRSAQAFADGGQLVVSPVTMKPRFNAVATSDDDRQEDTASLPDRFDARQAGIFAAGWTLGSLKYLAEAGIHSVTYFETAGRGGLLHGEQEAVNRQTFPARSGEIYPLYHLFRELGKISPSQILPTRSSHPLHFSSLLLNNDKSMVWILASHIPEGQKISLPEEFRCQSCHILGPRGMASMNAGGRHVTLAPYHIAFLEMRSN